VPALHRAASVFVLPSASEGMPNALLEALASGTPSVATDIPGTNELVRHEREALLVPLDDALALASAIVRLLEDRALAQRLAEAGRARIASDYDMERVADRYMALFGDGARKWPRPRYAPFLRMNAELVLFGARFTLYLARTGIEVSRAAVTSVVVAIKRRLGIERAILPSLKRRGA
jgi:hypothetical protein